MIKWPDIRVVAVSLVFLVFAIPSSALAIASSQAPFITIDPIGNHTVDSAFFINGTTNLPPEDSPLLFSIIEANNFHPGGGTGSFFCQNVSITPEKNGLNTWSVYASPDQWETFGGIQQTPQYDNIPPGVYLADISSFTTPAYESAQIFFMIPSPNASSPTEPRPGNQSLVAAFGIGGGAGPTTYEFTDFSPGYPTSWLWAFGDGTESTSQNPAHTYLKPGDYTITLTVKNEAGSNTTSTLLNVPDVPVSSTQALSTHNTELVYPTTPASPLSLIVSLIAIASVVVLHLTSRKKNR